MTGSTQEVAHEQAQKTTVEDQESLKALGGAVGAGVGAVVGGEAGEMAGQCCFLRYGRFYVSAAMLLSTRTESGAQLPS